MIECLPFYLLRADVRNDFRDASGPKAERGSGLRYVKVSYMLMAAPCRSKALYASECA